MFDGFNIGDEIDFGVRFECFIVIKWLGSKSIYAYRWLRWKTSKLWWRDGYYTCYKYARFGHQTNINIIRSKPFNMAYKILFFTKKVINLVHFIQGFETHSWNLSHTNVKFRFKYSPILWKASWYFIANNFVLADFIYTHACVILKVNHMHVTRRSGFNILMGCTRKTMVYLYSNLPIMFGFILMNTLLHLQMRHQPKMFLPNGMCHSQWTHILTNF